MTSDLATVTHAAFKASVPVVAVVNTVLASVSLSALVLATDGSVAVRRTEAAVAYKAVNLDSNRAA